MRCIQIPQINNLQPSARASVQFPLGQTYEKIYFSLGTTGLTKAMISNISLKINNKEFQRWATAADMDLLNAYKGNNINASYLVFDFTERKIRTEVGMKLGTVAACAEAGVQAFTLEFDVSAWTVTGGTAPTMWADVSEPSSNKILTRVQYQQKVIAAAAQDVVYCPFGQQGYQVKRFLVKHTNMTKFFVKRDSVEIWGDLPVALANFREQDFGNTPQAGLHVVDLMPDALSSNALNTAFIQAGFDAKGNPVTLPVQQLDIRATTSAADTLTIYTEAFSLNSQL